MICDLMFFLKCVMFYYYKKRFIWNGIIFIILVEFVRKDNYESYFVIIFV